MKTDLHLIAKFIIESDAIEGIMANADLVMEQVSYAYTEGHVGALLLLHKLAYDKKPLTHEIIQEVQGLITAEQSTKLGGPLLPPEYVGKYRKVGVRVGGRICPSPDQVPNRMMMLLVALNSWLNLQDKETLPSTNKLEIIAASHFNYEFIHPFADGNGRSGRAIVYYMMQYADLTPFVFTSYDRFDTYYPAFESHERMQDYFKSKYT